MTQNPEVAEASAPIDRPPPLTSAQRMRLHRMRRREGTRCVTVLLNNTGMEGLIRTGWLARADRTSRTAIRKALQFYLVDHLG